MPNLSRYMELGGPLMWPLLVCSVVLLAILLERSWSVLIKHKLLRRPASHAGLTWHRRALPFFIDVPPSVGLLGTVLGVVQSFNLINGRIDAQAMSAGLSVACLTTVFGLFIAITATVARYALDWITPPEPASVSTEEAPTPKPHAPHAPAPAKGGSGG